MCIRDSASSDQSTDDEVATIKVENGQELKFEEEHFEDEVASSDQSTAVELSQVNIENNGAITTSRGFTGLKKGWTDKTLDVLVDFAGGQIVFYCMWIILIIWIVLGIVYNAPFNWQVVMQDGQSIQCYVWDTLLMRQQLTSTHEQIMICGQLQSRMATFTHFLTKMGSSNSNSNSKASNDKSEKLDSNSNFELNEREPSHHSNVAIDSVIIDKKSIEGELPVENWYDRFSSVSSNIIGSVECMLSLIHI